MPRSSFGISLTRTAPGQTPYVTLCVHAGIAAPTPTGDEADAARYRT
jgi:hypothetical protein